jgi:OFA family oxalate/formate antiporter-like MFS transporter
VSNERKSAESQTDREILGYSRYVVLVAAFFAMFIISPFEYAWSAMSGHIGAIYGWSREQVALMFTLFVIGQSVGMLPGGLLRDKFGPRWTALLSEIVAVGICGKNGGIGAPLASVVPGASASDTESLTSL